MKTEPTAFDQLLSVLAAAGFEPVPAPRTYNRDELVRAIVGQQWAVAIACWQGYPASLAGVHIWSWTADALASLPCAVDVVDGKEGAL